MVGNDSKSCITTEFSQEDHPFLDAYYWMMDIVSKLCIGIIGVILNLITIIVYSTPTMKNNFFNRLLICLAIFDTLYLVCEISEAFRMWYDTFLQQILFVRFVYPIRNVLMCSSIYMNIAITFERYQAITSPAKHRAKATLNVTKRILTCTIPILIICTLYYSPKFFDLELSEKLECNFDNLSMNSLEMKSKNRNTSNCITKYYLSTTKLRQNHYYLLWYLNISNLIVTAFVPIGIVIYLNMKIYLSLKRFRHRRPSMIRRRSIIQQQSIELGTIGNTCSRQHRRQSTSSNASLKSQLEEIRSQQREDQKKTFILFSIVLVFIFCHSIRLVLNIDELLRMTKFIDEQGKDCDDPPFWGKIFAPLSQLLLLINASSNFFIYVFFDQSFQHVLKCVCIMKSDMKERTHKSRNHPDTMDSGLKATKALSKNISNNKELVAINEDEE